MVLGFPDTYEIGISNQAIQILYHLARGAAGVGVERAYLPWVDAIDAMRRAGVPLLTLETWTPGGRGRPARHHAAARVPLHQRARDARPGRHPAARGGARRRSIPWCSSGARPAPTSCRSSRFVDAVAVGDGEELFPEILRGAGRGAGAPACRARRPSGG